MILCSMIVVMFLYRKYTGESRVLEVSGDMAGIFYKAITAILTGPAFNLLLFLRAPFVSINHLIRGSAEYWWYYNYIYFFLFGCFILFIWVFYKLKPDYKADMNINLMSAGMKPYKKDDSVSVNEYFRKVIKLLFAAIILICLGYSVSFTHYVYIFTGRLTSVHLAASIGGSIIFGCVCASVFFLAERYGFKKFAVIILSAYLTLLTGYNTYAQREFVESWSYQKTFWSEVIKLSPDLQDNTVILSNIPQNKLDVTSKFIFPFQTFWNKYMIERLYWFPTKWQKPFYQNIYGNPEDDIHIMNGDFMLQSEYFPPFALQDSNVILIKMDEKNNLVRIDSTISINGKKLYLKPIGENTVDKLGRTKLYDLLINKE
ncbi:MAG: hypothetical protein IPL53_09685 [Ignavibacteria bacterium]|nr:hypothetical protein [Ignavibacteria bacterium]